MDSQEVRLNITQDVIQDLRSLTVDNLKRVIRLFNDKGLSIHGHLRLSGTKADLFSRLSHVVRTIYTTQRASFPSLVNIVSDVLRNIGSSPASARYAGYNSQYGAAPAYRPPAAQDYSASTSNGASHQNQALAYNRPDSYHLNGVPRPGYAAANLHGHVAAQASTSNPVVELIKFRPSPFYRIDKALSPVTHMPRAGQGDRKSVVINFVIPEPQRALILASKAANAKPYQVRLYCTTEDHYNPSRPTNLQLAAPIEFPGVCEIKLNHTNIVANTKGIKKQAGTAPPVDLMKGGALSYQSAGGVNRLEIVYINTDKRHSVVVNLVEVTSIEDLVTRVRGGTSRSKEDVVKKIVEMNSDPDVEASSFGLSLKDPLTMARISLPIRSSVCNHIACFDAKVFFMINEQTPSWTCPICSKELRVEDLFVDGYLQDVLRGCSSDVDQVSVEPDGSWHLIETEEHSTRQSRAGSVRAKADPDGPNGNDAKGKGRADTSSLSMTLEDSSDDEGGGGRGGARKAAPMNGAMNGKASGSGSGTGTSTPRGGKRMEAIDLTLSSDGEDAPAAPPSRAPPPPTTVTNGLPASRAPLSLPIRPGSATPAYSVPPPRPPSSNSSSGGANGSSSIGHQHPHHGTARPPFGGPSSSFDRSTAPTPSSRLINPLPHSSSSNSNPLKSTSTSHVPNFSTSAQSVLSRPMPWDVERERERERQRKRDAAAEVALEVARKRLRYEEHRYEDDYADEFD
ncbi:BQ5605_C035g11371 [Microbotryum silenes-dioicae]|uniref:BQ5605_C035g11371 protein n=1 Tax=Microbotryum silenes-dioicae TaxID=796604 RepID=A0A2X0PHB6_9BASI|nr:BQ5605_C035g11371 [Microbotryum silenes-dioicae]